MSNNKQTGKLACLLAWTYNTVKFEWSRITITLKMIGVTEDME